jgi:hypothetical protein
MTLKELLEQITRDRTPVLLKDRNKSWKACDLIGALSEPMLRRQVHMQPGLYVALINEKGYLGEVLFKIESKPA